MPPTLLETLQKERDAKASRAQELIDLQEEREVDQDGKKVKVEARALTDEEKTEFDAIADELGELNGRMRQIHEVHEARKVAADEAARSLAHITREPLTYRQDDQATSYWRDLASVSGIPVGDQRGALERLQRHAKEMDVVMPERAKRREQRGERYTSPFEKRAANRTDGTGGYFVPPDWMMDLAIAYLRYGRPFVNTCRQLDLPMGTDSINIPKLSGGTTTAAQTADNAAVSSTDITDTSVSGSVETVAGQEDLSLQLLEQSPAGLIDRFVTQDLIAAYNAECDLLALTGSGSSGQITGIQNASSVNSVTFTNASPSAYNLWTPLMQAKSQLEQNRKRADGQIFWMHPRRWNWLIAGLDGNDRPLVVPSPVAFNPLAENADPAMEGFVGTTIAGIPIYTDGQIPTTNNSNQDIVWDVRGQDCFWFEGELRTRVLPEILSGTLGVRFQVYNYIAFIVQYGQAISEITGTGLAAPSGF